MDGLSPVSPVCYTVGTVRIGLKTQLECLKDLFGGFFRAYLLYEG